MLLDHPLEKQNSTSPLQSSESGSKILYKERFLCLAPINLTSTDMLEPKIDSRLFNSHFLF